MIHQCQYCNYQSPYKWVVRRHEEKHGNAVQAAADIDSVERIDANRRRNDAIGADFGQEPN